MQGTANIIDAFRIVVAHRNAACCMYGRSARTAGVPEPLLCVIDRQHSVTAPQRDIFLTLDDRSRNRHAHETMISRPFNHPEENQRYFQIVPPAPAAYAKSAIRCQR